MHYCIVFCMRQVNLFIVIIRLMLSISLSQSHSDHINPIPLYLVNVINLNGSQCILFNVLYLNIVIIPLTLSVYICPKVITLTRLRCFENKKKFLRAGVEPAT
jgi:hypothetical protein